MYNEYYQVLASKSVQAKLPENYPADEEKLMISPNDFTTMAAKRQAILDEWQKRLRLQGRAEELRHPAVA